MIHLLSIKMLEQTGKRYFDVEIVAKHFGRLNLFYEYDGETVGLADSARNVDATAIFFRDDQFNLSFQDADLAIPGIEVVRDEIKKLC